MILHIDAASSQTTPFPQLILVSDDLIPRFLIFERDNLILVLMFLQLLQSVSLLVFDLLIVSHLNLLV